MTIEVDREWLTLQEASKITGKKPSALRGAIQRGRVMRVKKETGAIGDYWLIHRDELPKIGNNRSGAFEGVDRMIEVDPAIEVDRSESPIGGDRVNLVTVEYYDQQREKWDRERSQLEQGVMMYRYKFEELDRKVKLLPAPVEVVSDDLKRKQALIEKVKMMILAEKETRKKVESLLNEKEESLHAEVEHREKLLATLMEREQAFAVLNQKLAEEEKAKESLRAEWEKTVSELRRPWWKKIFRVK